MPGRIAIALLFMLAGLATAAAHGPTPQKADESITIAAPPEQVWAIVADFGGIGQWHPLVREVQATGGNAAGAERALTLQKGTITEGLDDVDTAGKRISYRLSKENTEAIPVSFYTASIEVLPAAGGSEVKWGARFYRADTTNEPPEDLNDETAIAAMTDFIRRGLEGLKAKAGGQ
ncbi:SRPBCC family protein [Ancylobacter terrae]|uniref:SRPBCC family protein n=1 Tax=Ancylobacter sp. sgz301288 TaxID=3342077 RepID=UPI00385890B1